MKKILKRVILLMLLLITVMTCGENSDKNKRIENNILAKNFNSLKKEYDGDKQRGFKFVKQYLTLNRSELFFADKVICIEGDTERILMPAMMYKVDKMQINYSIIVTKYFCN